MALSPRILTSSGLNRAVRGGAPVFQARQQGATGVPVTGTNAGQGLQMASDAAAGASAELVRAYQGEQAAHLAATLSRSEANLTTALAKAADESPLDHAGFLTRADAIGKTWVEGLPPQIRRQAETVYIQRRERQAQAILGNERAQQREEDKAELIGRMEISREAAMAAARGGDPAALEENAAAYEASRQALFAGAMLNAGQFVSLGKDLADGLERQQALAGMDGARRQGLRAGEAYIRRFEAGELHKDIKDPDQRERIAREMDRSLAEDRADFRRRQAEAEARWKANFGDNRDRVKVAAEAVLKGRQFEGFDGLKGDLAALAGQDERYQPLLQALNDAEHLADQTRDFAALPPETQQQLLAFKGERVQSAQDNDLLDAWEDIAARTETALQQDAHGWAGAQLGPDYQSPPLNPATVPGFAAALRQRAKATGRLAGYTGRAVPFLRPGDPAAIRDGIMGLPAAEQALRLHTIVQAAGPYAGQVFAALSPDLPQVAHAGGLLALGPEYHRAGEMALEGMQVEGIALPTDAAIWFAKEAGTAFAESPHSRAAAEGTADAIYKSMALQRGLIKDDPAEEDLYRRAVQMSMGRAGDREETGGLADAGGARVAVPPGMPVARLKTIFDSLKAPATGALVLNVMSVGGAPPKVSTGQPFDPAEDDFWPVPSGDGTYYLSTVDPTKGDVSYLRGSGKYGRFELDVRRFPDPPGKPKPASRQPRERTTGQPSRPPFSVEPWRSQQRDGEAER